MVFKSLRLLYSNTRQRVDSYTTARMLVGYYSCFST